MRVVFTKISDTTHAVAVTRSDGRSEHVELETREYLRHDLSHFVVKSELPIATGYWGCVTAGASLTGGGVGCSDAALAESLAGPMQTLFRIDAEREAFSELFSRFPQTSGMRDLAARVHERLRQLRGHWKATPYGGQLELVWAEPGLTRDAAS